MKQGNLEAVADYIARYDEIVDRVTSLGEVLSERAILIGRLNSKFDGFKRVWIKLQIRCIRNWLECYFKMKRKSTIIKHQKVWPYFRNRHIHARHEHSIQPNWTQKRNCCQKKIFNNCLINQPAEIVGIKGIGWSITRRKNSGDNDDKKTENPL